MTPDADDPIPSFPPGGSPFHVKGNGFRGQVAYIEAHVPGGLAAMLEAVPDETLADYLRQPFLAGSWYDLFPFIALHQAAGRTLGVSALEFAARYSRVQARQDISGVYRLLLKLASPDMVVARLPGVAGQYYDFIEVTNQQLGKGVYESRITGTPAAAAGMYRASSSAFVAEALTAAGAKGLELQWGRVRSRPRPPRRQDRDPHATRELDRLSGPGRGRAGGRRRSPGSPVGK